MASIAKESTLMLKLKERLSLLLPALTITTSFDASGAKLLAVGASSHQAMAVRIMKIATDFTDSVGQAQAIYAPLKCQVLEEATAADADTSIVKSPLKSQIDAEVCKLALIQERWMLPNGTAPALSQFNSDGTVGGSAVQEVDVRPDIQWPLSGQ